MPLEDDTVLFNSSRGKSIPFGSTLGLKALRVRVINGRPSVTKADGTPVSLTMLPDWEIKELFEHIEFAFEVGAL